MNYMNEQVSNTGSGEPVVSNISVIPWQLVLLVTAQHTQITQNLGRKAQRYGRVKPVNGISFLVFL